MTVATAAVTCRFFDVTTTFWANPGLVIACVVTGPPVHGKVGGRYGRGYPGRVNPLVKQTRFGMRNVFAATTWCALYAATVGWWLHGSEGRLLAVNFVGTLIGVVFARRWVEGNFRHGALGGGMGGAIGVVLPVVVTLLTGQPAPSPRSLGSLFLLGGLLGLLMGMVIAVVLDELRRIRRKLQRRR